METHARGWWRVAVGALCGVTVAAAAAPPGGLVVGTIRDATTLRPIPGAFATYAAPTADPIQAGPVVMAGTTGVVHTVRADGEGRFVFRDLAAGAYTFTARAPGYLDGGYGRRSPDDATARPFDLADGQAAAGVTIDLWPEARIAGRVVDERGIPLPKTWVQLGRRDGDRDRPRLVVVHTEPASAYTDADGAFWFGGVPAGEYVVAVPSRMTFVPPAAVGVDAGAQQQFRATGSGALGAGVAAISPAAPVGEFSLQTSDQGNWGGSNSLLGRPPEPRGDGRLMGSPATFYPGTAALAEAAAIAVKPGETVDALTIRITAVPMVPVSGTLGGPDGPAAGYAVHLFPTYAAGQLIERQFVFTTASGASGAFTFPAVPAGQYLLKAWRVPQALSIGRDPLPADPTLWAELPIAVDDAPVAGVSLTLRRGLAIAGTVQFDGATPPPPASAQNLIGRCFQPEWPLAMGNNFPSRVNAAGEFTTPGVPPGRAYVACPDALRGWSVESATWNGADLLTTPLVADRDDITGVAIRFTDRPSTIAGTVRRADGAVDADAVVAIFPERYQEWLRAGAGGMAARVAYTSQLGAYTVPAVPPGAYLIAAVDASRAASWRQAASLQAIAPRATRIVVAPHATARVDLRTLPR